MSEKALIVGGGGREHALAEYINESDAVSELYCAPGNGGTEAIAENVDLDIRDAKKIARFCVERQVDLAVVGPDDALEAGVVDALEEENITVFGPAKSAARLEWDKAFAHFFMDRYNIPHPEAWHFEDVDGARHFLRTVSPNHVVIKANSLAQGKGVTLPSSMEEAESALAEIMVDRKFGFGNTQVLVQEKIEGKELSVLAICHGEDYTLLPMSQDYKRRDDNDEGSNTGGMGTIAPANILSDKQLRDIEQKIIQPTLEGMAYEGRPFKGVLYTGIMLNENGPQVIEYNTRFGDPECQALLPLIDEDIYGLLSESSRGRIVTPKIKDMACALVVLASENYPAEKAEGEEIRGIDRPDNVVKVFHAGTAWRGNKCVAVGGRVLNVVGLSKDLHFALAKAYSSIGSQGIYFDNMHYRTDIGSNL